MGESMLSEESCADTGWLLCIAAGCSKATLYGHINEAVPAEIAERFFSYINRRKGCEPVQYIAGSWSFMGLDFTVNGDVLIPRADTECLVETVIRAAKEQFHEKLNATGTVDAKVAVSADSVMAAPSEMSKDSANSVNSINSTGSIDSGYSSDSANVFDGICMNLKADIPADVPLRILDLCTGSGCIAISLAHFLPTTRITASDISSSALAVAIKNAKALGVEHRITFIEEDLFSAEHVLGAPFDILCMNPPYISSGDISTLMPDVRNFEPLGALDGGADGLDFYRRVIADLPVYTHPGSFVAMEVGIGQADMVRCMLIGQGCRSVHIVNDLAGIERVVCAFV